MNYYYPPYNQYLNRPNGSDTMPLLLVITDFTPHMHKWVELSLSNGNTMTAFVVQITGPQSVKILKFPSLKTQTIDVNHVFGISEINPPQCW
ncbi:hypothetical protein [Bacillus cereus]|uniref:hypothetical protein n=1 Tax=Bacillus cereus TaxID=1396 RepID=UPI00192DEB0E|nr:hypothetical protein [Bacillus cereus]MDA2331513.1 hypothetical protein [Bacillus cereus]MDA2337373.1 hypothetical protein [Bacillus cereus]